MHIFQHLHFYITGFSLKSSEAFKSDYLLPIFWFFLSRPTAFCLIKNNHWIICLLCYVYCFVVRCPHFIFRWFTTSHIHISVAYKLQFKLQSIQCFATWLIAFCKLLTVNNAMVRSPANNTPGLPFFQWLVRVKFLELYTVNCLL
jgi:hypothetical protein